MAKLQFFPLGLLVLGIARLTACCLVALARAVEESSKPIIMMMRVGATLPLFRTATGWIFAAFMPRTVVRPLMRSEKSAGRGPVERLDRVALEAKLREIRSSYLASHSGHLLPGVSAVATPLLDSRGSVVAAISVFGSTEDFDASPAGLAAHALKDAGLTFRHSAGHAS